MKTLEIRSLTKKGEKAIGQHIKETDNLKLRQRLIFKTAGYKQTIISKSPFVVELEIKNRFSNNPLFLNLILEQINDALKLNGGVRDIDYTLKEVKA